MKWTATVMIFLHITIAAVLGSAAALSTATIAQGVDQQDKTGGHGAVAGPADGANQQARPDETLRYCDSGYPDPGTAADSGTGANVPTAKVWTGAPLRIWAPRRCRVPSYPAAEPGKLAQKRL